MADENKKPQIPEAEFKMPEETFGQTSAQNSSALGVILAVLIVILVLLLGGLYLWGTTLQIDKPAYTPPPARPTAEENNEPESTRAEANVQALETVSTSDELGAIEADLGSTDLDSFESELNAIESALDASLE